MDRQSDDQRLAAALIAYLERRFGRHDDLLSLAHLLLPSRAPFYETSVAVDLEDREGSADIFFRYRLDFKARVDEIFFAVSRSPAVTESLLASIPELTEVTTLGDTESLDSAVRLLLEGDLQISLFQNTERGTARFRELPLRLLTEEQSLDVVSRSESTVPVSQFRIISTDSVVSPSELSRISIVMARRLDEDVWCLPWLADRPIFLQSFSVDARACHRDIKIETYPFMTTNERAYSLPTTANDRVVLHLNHWLTAGQGVMMAWRPPRSPSADSVYGLSPTSA